ncbi:MAG: hypothetical protein M5U26_00260 [Planctomycetota bacterium]|nr:hypothetical protein [Planctomycetota bacterium]
MDQASQPTEVRPSGEAPPFIGPGSAQPPKKKSGLGCWLWVLIFLGLFLLAVGICVYSVVSTFKWIENAAESAPQQVPAVNLSDPQVLDLQQTYLKYRACYLEKKDFEAMLTFDQLNHIIQEEKKKQENRQDPEAKDRIHFETAGDAIRTRFTHYDKDTGRYLNVECVGNAYIENRQLTLTIDSLKMAGKEAPWGVRKLANWFVSAVKEEQSKKSDEQNPLRFIKLLKREGDKIHVILDGQYLPDPDKDAKERNGLNLNAPAESPGGALRLPAPRFALARL